MKAREGINRRWRRGCEHNGRSGSAAPDANHAPQLRASRTPSMSIDETTLPRMTGEAGLLMSTTTSESERYAAT